MIRKPVCGALWPTAIGNLASGGVPTKLLMKDHKVRLCSVSLTLIELGVNIRQKSMLSAVEDGKPTVRGI